MFGAKLMMPVDMKAAAMADGCGDIVSCKYVRSVKVKDDGRRYFLSSR
jgi:hypothetical protein